MKTFSVSSLIFVALFLAGCKPAPIPKWNGKIYAGDSARQGIARSQENEFIAAKDPRFDGYLAISYADFRAFYETYVLGCKEWKNGTGMMSAREALSLLPFESVAKLQEAFTEEKK